jgi:hypothetical protein
MPGGVGDPDHLDQLGFEMGEGKQHVPSIADHDTTGGTGITRMVTGCVSMP